MNFDTWLILLVTCVGASIIPGPNSLMVFNHVVRFGLRKTLWTIWGGVFGFIILIALVVFGIGSIIDTHPNIIIFIKIIGGVYLVLIGFVLWNSGAIEYHESDDEDLSGSGSSLFKHGFISAVTNVNALMFFISITPHFMEPEKGLFIQFLEIGLTLALTEFCIEMIYALIIHRYRNGMIRTGRIFNKVCGGLFVLFAIMLQFR